MQKIEDVVNPVIGETYLVRCVHQVLEYKIGTYSNWCPVVGDFHEDKGIAQEQYHFHVDWRFMPQFYIEEIEKIYKSWGMFLGEENTHNYVAITQKMIVGRKLGYNYSTFEQVTQEQLDTTLIIEEEDIKYLPLVYQRNFAPLADSTFEKLVTIYKTSGKRMKNMICPHKKTKLHSCKTIGDIVQCPLHGLKWNVKTGELSNC